MNSPYSQAQEADSLERCSSDSGPSDTSKSTTTASECLLPESKTESCPTPLSLAISAHSLVLDLPAFIEGLRMSSQPVSLAKRGAMQRQGEITRKIDGRKCLRLSESYSRLLFSPKMWTRELSSPLKAILPVVDTKHVAAAFPRKTWVQTIIGSDGGFLHTPTTKANYSAESMQKWRCCRNFVTVFGRPTPRNQEWMMGIPIGWTDTAPLEICKFHLWQQWHGRLCQSNVPNNFRGRNESLFS